MPAAVSPIIAQISSKELPYEGLTVAKYLKDLPSSSCSVLDLDFHIVAASHHDLAILRAYFHAICQCSEFESCCYVSYWR